MPDYNSARAAGIAAIDDLDNWQGKATLSSQLAAASASAAQVTQLQADLTAANAKITKLIAFKDLALADANARGAADAAKVEGKNLIDAAVGL